MRTEDTLQTAIADELHGLERSRGGFTFAADQNAGSRSGREGARLKRAGMRAGEADIRVYLPAARMKHIEVKTSKGQLSKAQRERHATLRALGHEVVVLRAATPAEAATKARALVERWLEESEMSEEGGALTPGTVIKKPCRRCGSRVRYRSGSCVECSRRKCREYEARHRKGWPRGENDGRSSHPLYNIWIGMHERCSNPRCNVFQHYGGRGIKVDSRWHGPSGFWEFVSDIGERPAGTSLDRIDNNGDYTPENCRWATSTEQNRNSRQCKMNDAALSRLRQMREQGAPDVAIAAELGVSNVLVAKRAREMGLGRSPRSWVRG